MTAYCATCNGFQCQCRLGWVTSLSAETQARGEMVRRNLPRGMLLWERTAAREAEIERLLAVQPQHLQPDELLELYLLELIEALKSDRARRVKEGL